MYPEYIVELKCREFAKLIDGIRRYGGKCPERKWRGPFCRALQVYEAFWRYRGGEVPLDAATLGLTEKHVPFLIRAQRAYGKSAPFESLVIYYIAVLDEMQRRQLALDLAKMLGAI